MSAMNSQINRGLRKLSYNMSSLVPNECNELYENMRRYDHLFTLIIVITTHILTLLVSNVSFIQSNSYLCPLLYSIKIGEQILIINSIVMYIHWFWILLYYCTLLYSPFSVSIIKFCFLLTNEIYFDIIFYETFNTVLVP